MCSQFNFKRDPSLNTSALNAKRTCHGVLSDISPETKLKNTIVSKGGRILASAALFSVLLGGCSAMRSWGMKMTSPDQPPGPPLVQNCGIVSIGSPTKYVCGGKVYTGFQLNKLRQASKRRTAIHSQPIEEREK
jgi:hypothetical protein